MYDKGINYANEQYKNADGTTQNAGFLAGRRLEIQLFLPFFQELTNDILC